jgi:radical SAM protein with 4Fe4S-binding SPASM domain
MDLPPPQYLQLYPTTKCNQRCTFCFNPDQEEHHDLTFDRALSLLNILSRNSINNLDIMGGEPFLLPWMADFLRAGLSMGMALNISTNGSLPAQLEGLKDIPLQNFNIGISLEGSTPGKHNCLTGSDNFSVAIASIKKLLDFSLDPIVKTVLSPETLPDIQHIVHLVKGIGVRRYYIIHMDMLVERHGRSKETIGYVEFHNAFQKIRESNPDIEVHQVHASCFDRGSLPQGVRCAGGVRKLSVMPDGTVFPCNLFHAFPEFAAGNIFRDSFSEIWRHPRLDFFRSYAINHCALAHCENRRSCTGGCPAHGYAGSRDLDATDLRCVHSLRRQTTDSLHQ